MLEGENLTPDTLKLYHNGVLYTPLESSDTYAYYILGDNGTNKIMLNGKTFETIIIKDVVVPVGFPISIALDQRDSIDTGFNYANRINRKNFSSVNCANYGYPENVNYPYFWVFTQQITNSSLNDFTIVNGTFEASEFAEHRTILVCKATGSLPVYIKYQGFIIAVFNYHA